MQIIIICAEQVQCWESCLHLTGFRVRPPKTFREFNIQLCWGLKKSTQTYVFTSLFTRTQTEWGIGGQKYDSVNFELSVQHLLCRWWRKKKGIGTRSKIKLACLFVLCVSGFAQNITTNAMKRRPIFTTFRNNCCCCSLTWFLGQFK